MSDLEQEFITLCHSQLIQLLPFNTEFEILSAVREYCAYHPSTTDVNEVVANCFLQLGASETTERDESMRNMTLALVQSLAQEYPQFTKDIISNVVTDFLLEEQLVDLDLTMNHCRAVLSEKLYTLTDKIASCIHGRFPNISEIDLRDMVSAFVSSNSSICGLSSSEVADQCITTFLLSESSGELESSREMEDVLHEVVSVYPNINLEYLQGLYEETKLPAEGLVNYISEHPDEVRMDAVDLKSASVDYFQNDAVTSATYRQSALVEIQRNFPFLANASVEAAFEDNRFHYLPTVRYLEELTGTGPQLEINDTFTLSKEAMCAIKAKCEAVNPKITICSRAMLAHHTRISLPFAMDRDLKEEVLWFRNKRRADIEAQDHLMAEEINLKMAAEDNALVECDCCVTDYALEQMVACSEGHLFCTQCVQKYVEDALFGSGKTHIRCMCSSESCPGYYPEDMLRRALSEMLFNKLTEAKFRDAIKDAQLDNVVSCYHCIMKVVWEDDGNHILSCPSCHRDTCLICNQPSHIPFKCRHILEQEEKLDSENTKRRLMIEEAMTAARVRECPKCKQRFDKVEGCNRMTCTARGCGASSCYLCRKDITAEGYNHFKETADGCRLHTNTVEDDRLAVREAAMKMLAEIEKRCKEDGETDVNMQATIDWINKLLTDNK